LACLPTRSRPPEIFGEKMEFLQISKLALGAAAIFTWLSLGNGIARADSLMLTPAQTLSVGTMGTAMNYNRAFKGVFHFSALRVNQDSSGNL
jgi:hypothetical protein